MRDLRFRFRYLSSALASAVFLVACGGGDSGPTGTTPVLTSVTITTTSQTVVAGQTRQLTATAKDQNNATIAATVTWSSSPLTIATVNSSSGLVTGVLAGAATITATATAGGTTVTKTILITVTAGQILTTVTVTGGGNVGIGQTRQLTAAAKDQNGSPITATITWVSSLLGIATVNSSSGLVTGVAAGTATITASATIGGVTKTGTADVTVTAPAALVLTSVSVSGGTSVVIGQTLQLTASPRDQNGNAIAATVVWTTSAQGTATVNAATGLVTGVAAGAVTITATATAGVVTVVGNNQMTVAGAFPSAINVTASLANLFEPSTVDIARLGTVSFIFLAVEHDVTFTAATGVPQNIAATSNATVGRTFNTAGTFQFLCSIHGSSMSGTVIVH